MKASDNAALLCIDAPGVSAYIVLRGSEVPSNPPSQADALALLERVLDHARGRPTAQQPADPVDEIRERAQRETAALTEQFHRDLANIEFVRSLSAGENGK